MTRRRILADILVAGLLVGIAHCKPAPEKTKAIPPPPQGTSQPVPPQQPRAGPATLENTYWKLTHLGDRPVLVTLDQPEPYLTLDSVTGRASGSGGCNRFGGTYRLDGGGLSFGPLAATLMACPAGMEIENPFLGRLSGVHRWRITGQQLELLDADGTVVLRFERGSRST